MAGSAVHAPSPMLQSMIDAFRAADARVKDFVGKQQQVSAQLTENSMVKAELDALLEGEPVYKLQGKVLVLHDAAEAKATVVQRIQMIEGELCVHAPVNRGVAFFLNAAKPPACDALTPSLRSGKLEKLIAEGQQQVAKLRSEIGAKQEAEAAARRVEE